jgi:hypothetical protein
MVEVLHAMKAPLMIPMHYFSAIRSTVPATRTTGVECRSRRNTIAGGVEATLAKPKVLVLPGH